MKNHLLMLVSIVVVVYANHSAAASPTEQVASLAQGCYSIKSPATGKFVQQYNSGGTINGGQSFGFRTTDLNQADKFFFKPTSFSKFLLTNSNRRYLASRLPAEPTAGTYAGEFAEWEIQGIPWGSGFRYRFHNQGIGSMLRHNTSTNNFYYFDLLNPGNNSSEHEFWLIPRSDCLPFIEMQVNVNGNPDLLKSNAGAPVRGVIDAHTHIYSNEFMGGKFVHGRPFHPYGVENALPNSDGIHGPYGALDLIGNIFAFNDINNRYDTRGWPEFPYWPNHLSVSHTGYYYKWMERAWLGGVRMMVSHMVENKVLCTSQSTINPASWINPNSCESKDSVRLQIRRHFELQNYIDAQHGGPGKGWFRIVTSPAQARQVIADGKMAILMGIEVSELFDCGVQSQNCTLAKVEAEMQEMFRLGIRGFFPTHRFDNLLGGSEIEGGFLNVGQALSAGYLFDVEHCDDHTEGASLEPGFPLIGNIPVLGDIANSIAQTPDYDPNQRSCNQQGISELGVYLINRMIDMGFLIELDHTSNKTAQSILDIAEARNYSGLISAHSHLQKGRNNELHPNMHRLLALGGFVAPYNFETNRMINEVGQYLSAVEQTNFVKGVGIGSDMSGLAQQAGPPSDAASSPLEYPFVNEFGLEFDRQVSGNRVIDYNNDGVAHYGMLADHIQDMRERAPARVYEALMNSTEAYLQMWERSIANTNSNFIDPINQEIRIVNRHSGRCLGVPGDDDNVNELVIVTQEHCDHKQTDQRWVYNANTGRISTALNPSLCLDARQTSNNGAAMLRSCIDEAWANWNYEGYILRNRANRRFVLDSTKGRNSVQMWGEHGDWNQQWELRTERQVFNWVTLRSAMGNGCMDVHNASTQNGTHLKMWACNGNAAQLFYYNPDDRTLRSALNSNKCVDLASADVTNGTAIHLWDCHGRENQQWDLDGEILRSRMNSNKVIDVNGSHHGARLSIWDHHGRQNQRWRTVLQ